MQTAVHHRYSLLISLWEEHFWWFSHLNLKGRLPCLSANWEKKKEKKHNKCWRFTVADQEAWQKWHMCCQRRKALKSSMLHARWQIMQIIETLPTFLETNVWNRPGGQSAGDEWVMLMSGGRRRLTKHTKCHSHQSNIKDMGSWKSRFHRCHSSSAYLLAICLCCSPLDLAFHEHAVLLNCLWPVCLWLGASQRSPVFLWSV